MRKTNLNPHRVWLGLFGVWSFLLTGVISGFIGGPGALQAIRLENLLHAKYTKMNALQNQLTGLQSEAEEIEKSAVVQQREIRRVLGYAAPDELIFDFSEGSSL